MSELQNVARPQYEEFVGYLRSALHYLYDPVHLRRSPLVELLNQSAASDRAAALQRILVESIRLLKPNENEPPQSSAWRVYDTLSLQYIRQFTRDIVATQLGISERQLRREQRMAIEALAQQLWQKYNLETLPSLTRSADPMVTEKSEALSTELGWLKNSGTEQIGTLQDILHTVLELVQPLAKQRQVPLDLVIETGLEELPAPQMTIRSILLTVLNAVIPSVNEGSVSIYVLRSNPDIQIEITCSGWNPPAPQMTHPDSQDETGLNAAHQLASFYGANLSVEQNERVLKALLRFPAPEQVPILVIDDNADWLDMLKRYAVGSRYRITTTSEPRTAAAFAEKIQPALIFLDVMMPNVDGWHVLSELRQTQGTHPIPIVVCTVLPLANLALSLGVNAFLQKPITQDQFLDILDRLTQPPAV